jgi:hypothetical protein
MRRDVVAVVAAAGALLGAPAPRAGAQEGPQLRAGLAAVSQPVLLDTLARPFKVLGPRVTLLAHLVAAYDSLGIPIDFKDSGAGILVAERFSVRRELKKVRLSKYLDCGQGFNGLNANEYRITLVVAGWLHPATGDPKELRMAVVGSGMNMAGSNSQSVLCTSTGALEGVIVDIIRNRQRGLIPGGM